MILATIYFLLFCFLISKLTFFKDDVLSLKTIFSILIIKCLACFAYYWVYFCYYPAGFNGDSMEAEAWAYLAVRAMRGLPITFPGTTGVARELTGGVIVGNDDLR